MTKLQLEERVSNLENKIEEVQRVLEPIEKLTTVVDNLEKSISQGHFCKWNTELGKLQEFRKNSTTNIRHIYDEIDNYNEELDELSQVLTELNTGKKILERVEQNQEEYNFAIEQERRRTKITIYVAVAVVLLTFVFNVVLEFFRSNF